MKKVSGRMLGAFAVIAVGTSLTSASRAEDAASYYRGKTVRIIVGYGPGGGYDAYARMIAPVFAKNLGATVVVENQPGAGGLTALDNLYVAPKDGLQTMIVNGSGAGLAQLVGQSTARYDLAKMGHLGTVSASPWMWLASPKSSIDDPQRAIDAHRQYMWSGSGPMDGLSDGAAFTCAALQMQCRIVMGYPGSNEAALAVSKGEMDFVYISDTSAANYVEAGQAKPIAVMSRKGSRFFPKSPSIFQAVKLGPDAQWLFDFHATLEALGRIFVVPPDTPPDRLAFLQTAMAKTLRDPVLVAQGEKTQRYIDFVDADTTRAAVSKTVNDVTPDQRARVKKLVAP
jgi:tripartite-type tricarboxylate transporter receptor subunit TctC